MTREFLLLSIDDSLSLGTSEMPIRSHTLSVTPQQPCAVSILSLTSEQRKIGPSKLTSVPKGLPRPGMERLAES